MTKKKTVAAPKKAAKKPAKKKAPAKAAKPDDVQVTKKERPLPINQRPSFVRTSAEFVAYLARFASKEETRYYLKGICVERHHKKGILMTASDGHRLGCFYDEDGILEGPESIIVPVDQKLKTAAGKKYGSLPVNFIWANGFSYVISGVDFQPSDFEDVQKLNGLIEYVEPAPLIDGTYPNWRYVIPQKQGPQKTAMVNGNYVKDFVTKNCGGYGVQFFHGETRADPILVRVSDYHNFCGVLMPMRESASENQAMPDFMREEMRLAEVKKAKAAKKKAAKKADDSAKIAQAEARQAKTKAKKAPAKKRASKK